MSTFGWVSLTVGAGFLGFDLGAGPDWKEWGSFAAGAVLVLAGVWAVLKGRRHLTPVLTSLQGLPVDERIVVFLRSFKDDTGFSRVAALRWFRLLFTFMLPTPAHLRTEEDQVGRAFAPFGRMVALGSTTDELPRLGADRHYASDGTWWNQLLAALDRSALVVLAAGAGRNLDREVRELVRRNDPTRLVLLVVRDHDQYTRFRAALGSQFPRGLPDFPPKRVRHRLLRGRYVRAAIWFDHDWTPHWEMLDGRFPLAGIARRTQRVLPRALLSVYRRAGTPLRVKPTARRRPWEVKLSVVMIAAFWLAPMLLPLLAVALLHAVSDVIIFLDPDAADTLAGNSDLGAFYTHWLFLVWVAVVAACVYRVWCGGPYAIMITRMQGVFFPVLLLATLIGALPASGLWLLAVLGLLVLALLGLPVAALLLLRRNAREWVDSRL
ncbi:hypothetical protein STPH2_0621 [Streptomyces sp. KO7888]|uniref:hypothetical protein n=1 Tax=unclassified Streptomyces TaxID=2593676 RepID=UPI0013F5E4E7|nr:hypothetical protein [Streptomyces sp. KO7888]NHI05258.1 hypothetical protein [Streptomyces sp. KO7888]